MKCDKCGKEDVEAKDGMIAKIIPFEECFICDSCLNTERTIEELVVEINKLKI